MTAEGIRAVNGLAGKYEIAGALRLEADKDAGKPEFNQLNITYTSTAPLKLTLEFQEGETDTLYIGRASEPAALRFLMKGYTEGKPASGLAAIEFTVLEGEKGSLGLYFFGVSVRKPLTDGMVYIESERYKVGSYLIWGGGLSYIEDKRLSLSEFRNLLNHADTGRLVQQSYYGTSRPPYVKGEFMGNPWPYNPVQGGDRGNNRSRLIDFSASAKEIYVKCQPRDWGHDGSITPSYMENRYLIDGDAIRVDNAFTDFSGYDNPCTTQELPAFYVVSGLDRFVYYAKDRPWTGDGPLTVEDGLPFWAGGVPECYCSFKGKDAENWCAWVNSDGYGLGLFVPSADTMVKGRFSYSGTYDPSAGPTNYVAPLRRLKLLSYRTLRYSYLMVSGHIDEIRSVFTRRRKEITNSELDRFDPNSDSGIFEGTRSDTGSGS